MIRKYGNLLINLTRCDRIEHLMKGFRDIKSTSVIRFHMSDIEALAFSSRFSFVDINMGSPEAASQEFNSIHNVLQRYYDRC